MAWNTGMNKIRVILKIIEYLSRISVGVGVVFAIIQYFLIKKDTKTKYNRELVSWTSELLRTFYKEILPKYEQLCKNIPDKFYLSGDIIKIEITNSVDVVNNYKTYMDTIIEQNIKDDMKDLAINLQQLAVGLSYGNADIDVAKRVIYKKYITIVEVVLPSIITDENVELYKECIDLFNTWRYELKKIEHDKHGEALEFVSKDLCEYKKNIV
jgi:hypothetical protein